MNAGFLAVPTPPPKPALDPPMPAEDRNSLVQLCMQHDLITAALYACSAVPPLIITHHLQGYILLQSEK